jgi:hypothetical protein
MKKIVFYIIILFVFFIVCGGCDCDLDFPTQPQGHMPPEFLVGEWKSFDNIEQITIQKDFQIVVQNKRREYHFVVDGKGKRIFADRTMLPYEPTYKYIETAGHFIIREPARLEETFSIYWVDPVNSSRPFGIFKFKNGYALYTYVGDPDNPNSLVLLYKKP